jgi:hypothetical protein
MKPHLRLMVVSLIILSSCSSPNKVDNKNYYGLFGETSWMIELMDEGSFKFEIVGHYVTDTLRGSYRFNGDTLKLTPIHFKETHEQNVDLRFLLVDRNCLVGLTTGHDYCDNRTDDWCSRSWDLKEMKVARDCEY